jgi:hypothetical protein
MTERKWRVVSATSRNDFYNKVEKYEKIGYVLLPESFTYMTNRGMACLMKKE